MIITKDSRIVEVFSEDLFNKTKDRNELEDAKKYIQELASNPTPDNRYEIAQIMSYVIEEGFNERMNYLDMIADVKETDFQEKAQFEIEVDGLKAMFQAKSASTERSQVSTKYVQLDTEEVSIRPQVNFLDLQSGKVDLTRLADQAARKMEIAVIKRIQDSIYAAFKEMGGANYATGAGVSKNAFDPIMYAMRRAGGQASIVGDIEALAKFTELSGFDGRVAETLANEHNANGMVGKYNGSALVQLDNPFQANSLNKTELRKDLIYVIPSVEESMNPVKVQFEGGVQYLEGGVDLNSKTTEFRFDRYVGVGVVGARKLLGVYEDSTLSE